MRSRHSVDRLRDDMLRGRQRYLFAAFRLCYEVHWEIPHTDNGSCTASLPDRLAADLETERRISYHLLCDLRPLGSRRRRVADTSEW